MPSTPLLLRRDAMMPQPAARSKRPFYNALRFHTAPRGNPQNASVRPLGHCWPACSAWRQPSRAGHAVRSSLVRRCFEEARCLNESAIGAKAAEAAPLHEGPAILVVHRPEEESLVVMLEKAVVSEVCARELLLRLRDADHEFLYASGLSSSRRIAKACRERNDFVMIVALDPPDFRTISDFRKRHLKALGALFLQVLKLCETAGLVKLGHVALDGTKIKANASKHKAMSYERMKKREEELKAEIARMLAAAEAADAEEDETFGKNKRGDEMPDWAGDKQKRLAKIQQAMAALEADARLAAEEERRIEAEKEQQRLAEGRKKPGKPAAPPSEEPNPKAQRNFTDPESRIMKSKDGFVQAYNAQAAVDAGAQ